MLITRSPLISIMQRLSEEQSRFNQFIQWYGQQGHWFKLGIGLSIACISAVIGALIQMTLVLSLLSSLIYFFFHQFIQQEYTHQSRVEHILSVNINQLEVQLNSSLCHVQALENEITEVSTLLKNEIQTNILTFSAETALLKEQNQTLDGTILALQQSNHDLMEKNQQVNLALQNQIQQLNSLQLAITADAKHLSQITLEFEQTQQQWLTHLSNAQDYPCITEWETKALHTQQTLKNDLQDISNDDFLFQRVMSQRKPACIDNPKLSLQ